MAAALARARRAAAFAAKRSRLSAKYRSSAARSPAKVNCFWTLVGTSPSQCNLPLPRGIKCGISWTAQAIGPIFKYFSTRLFWAASL
eukprot:9467836-Pyramimonas_sp.AAC.1